MGTSWSAETASTFQVVFEKAEQPRQTDGLSALHVTGFAKKNIFHSQNLTYYLKIDRAIS